MSAAILLLGLQSVSQLALGISHADSYGHATEAIEHHHVLDPSLCFHKVGQPGPVIHCHTITAAAPAIIPEWSPDPKDKVSDDGEIAAFPRRAGSHLPPLRSRPSRLPAFILFANFRS